MRYADLPKYTRTDIYHRDIIKKELNDIDKLKEKLNPLILSLKPEFDSKYPEEFTIVKKLINFKFENLVDYFLKCIKELRNHKDKDVKIIIDILIGENNVFGHLRKLQSIFYKYNPNKTTYYYDMMECLCNPYLETMYNVIVMCENLFGKEGFGFNLLEKEEGYGFD